MAHEEKTAETIRPEYNVYVYHASGPEERQEIWAKAKTTFNPKRAMAEAERLHASRKYPRIEIKKKTFDKNSNLPTVSVFKVYKTGTRDFSAVRDIVLLSGLFLFGLVYVGCFILMAL